MKSSLIPFITTLKNFLPLKEHFIRYRWPLAIGLVCLLSVDFLQLLIPLVIKKVIDLLTVRTATPTTLVYYGAVILMIAVAMVPIWFWRNVAALAYGVSILLLLFVEFFGVVGMGAQRWIDLGFMRLQPSEVTKITLVMILAASGLTW